MSKPAPLVSVIIPAYKARATLSAALASIASSGLPEDQIEVVIAPDDGDSYEGLPDHGLPLVRCARHHIATGAGPARNRAIARAEGRYIAFLDADDTWAPGYLATLLPLARRAGAAFGHTCIVAQGERLFHLPDTCRDHLEFEDFGRTGASFHPVLRRDLAGPFVDRPSQDVLHAIEVLSCVGGAAPLGPGIYELHLSAQSASANADFATRVAKAYSEHIIDITDGRTRLNPRDIPSARAVFEAKARQNEAFLRDGAGRFFYAFQRDRNRATRRA